MKLLFSKFTLFFSVLFAFGVFGQTLSALPASPTAQTEKLLTKNEVDPLKALQSVVDFKFDKNIKNLDAKQLKKLLSGSTLNAEFLKIIYFTVIQAVVVTCLHDYNIRKHGDYAVFCNAVNGVFNTDPRLEYLGRGILIALISRGSDSLPKLGIKGALVPGLFSGSLTWVGLALCLVMRYWLQKHPKKNDLNFALITELNACNTPEKLNEFKEKHKADLLSLFKKNQDANDPRKIAAFFVAICVTWLLPEMIRTVSKKSDDARKSKKPSDEVRPASGGGHDGDPLVYEDLPARALEESTRDAQEKELIRKYPLIKFLIDSCDTDSTPESLALKKRLLGCTAHDECGICIDGDSEESNPDKGKVLIDHPNCNCSTWYHRGCIQEWLEKSHHTCPTCRQNVEHNKFIQIN